MAWIYQITPEMKKAERLCNERGIYMKIVIIHDRYDYIYIDYWDTEQEKRSPKPYLSIKEAEMIIYNHYIKICKKLKIPL